MDNRQTNNEGKKEEYYPQSNILVNKKSLKNKNSKRRIPDRPSPPNSPIIPQFNSSSPPLPKINNNKSNVGATVAALAAVLATAPTVAARRQNSSKNSNLGEEGLLSIPRQNNQKNNYSDCSPLLSRSTPILVEGKTKTNNNNYILRSNEQQQQSSSISSPIIPSYSNNKNNIISPPFSSSSSYSLRRSIRNEFDAFKRKSISELSLVLEVLKTATTTTNKTNSDYKKDCWGRGTTDNDEYYYKATSAIYGNEGRRKGRKEEEVGEHNNNYFINSSLSDNCFLPSHHHSTGNLTTIPFSRKTQRRMALRRKIQWERLSPAAIQRQIVHVQEEKAMLQAPTAPISAAKFVTYVQERRKKRILFKGEFLMVQRSVNPERATTEVGIRMGDKNQYPDTLPYDYNRVILEHRQGIEDSHYINASYVNSWLREGAYLVTQSVKNKQSSNELWRCVWEIGANTIVMLTKIFDFMRVVCLQYWPQTQFQFGEIHVETLDTRTYAHFVIRTFRLRKTGGVGDLTTTIPSKGGETQNKNITYEERIVKHFHFTEWELNSFPYISAFVEVRRRVRQWMEKSPVDAPIIVHCSNGGGRSGAFLAVDANLELLQKTGQLDVYEYARTLINSRQNLISSVEQYTFIYDVLCEAVLCNVQPMEMHQLKDRSTMYKARKNRELMELQDSHENKLLTMLTSPLRIGDCAGGHRLENRGKNRDVMVVPPDHARPYLQTLHGESKDYTYINAVEVDGFTRKAEFIVTEWPKQQTLDSFWTLVFDHNVHTVICLTNQPNDLKAYPQFVHNKGKKNYGPFTIEIVNFQQYPGLCSYMVKISKRPMEEIVEKRKWLFNRRKSNNSKEGGGTSSSSSGHQRLRRRPTLSHFLAECEKQRRRDSGPPISSSSGFNNNLINQKEDDLMSTSLNDPNFRLQQKYWGKIHRRTPTPTPSPDLENSSSDNDNTTNNSSSSKCSEEEEEDLISFESNEFNEINFNKNNNKKEQISSEGFIRNKKTTEYLRQRERERPLSDGALLPEQEIMMKISLSDAHRPKRDERGRRLGGEWDKRFERLGNQLIAKLNERGGEREDNNNNNNKSCSSPNYPTIITTKKTFSQSTKSRSRKSSKSTKKSHKNYSHRGSSRRYRRRRERHFSEPNLGTLERFEKPTNAPMPLLMPVEKPIGNKKLCGTDEIKNLLNVKRSIPTRRDLAEQMDKLTFMISEIMATGASQQQLEAEVRLCCIIQVKMWPIENKVPLSTTALIEVLKMTRSWRKRAPDRPESRPTIVMSHNGVSRCGIFIAANVLIDQMEMDHEVDVFHAVKLIRLNRPQLIDGPRTRFTGDAKDEYKYLYDLMLHWYMTNPELRSFEPPEVDSLESDEGSGSESIGESQSLGASISHKRSIRSKGRRRSTQRSKSSKASRRTNATTANSLIDAQKTDEQKKKIELLYLN